MKAVRFGSYSSRSTIAGTLNLRRLKSTRRYDCLCPPPRKRLVMRPWLLRPPVEDLPSVRPLTGLPFHSSLRSIRTVPRRLAVTGLKCFSAIIRASHQTGGEIDALALGESHERLLHVGAHARAALEPLGLALRDQRVHTGNLNLEQSLDRSLDLRLRRVARHLEHELVLLGKKRRLFGDVRSAHDFVHTLR